MVIIYWLIVILIFYIINLLLNNKEYFCYGNDFCNGNKDSALCINQECLECGLQSPCKTDENCYPSLCNEGCCDGN